MPLVGELVAAAAAAAVLLVQLAREEDQRARVWTGWRDNDELLGRTGRRSTWPNQVIAALPSAGANSTGSSSTVPHIPCFERSTDDSNWCTLSPTMFGCLLVDLSCSWSVLRWWHLDCPPEPRHCRSSACHLSGPLRRLVDIVDCIEQTLSSSLSNSCTVVEDSMLFRACTPAFFLAASFMRF